MYDKPESEVTGGARWGPEETAWRAEGGLVVFAAVDRAGVVHARGLPPVALLPARFAGLPVVREALLGAFVCDLRVERDLAARALLDGGAAPAAGDRAFKDVESRFRHWRRWESWR